MKRHLRFLIPALIAIWATESSAQKKPSGDTYIGYVYPAGGQQGTTVEIRIGGQGLDKVYGATVSGEGVHAKIVECRRKMGNQETRLLQEQINQLKKSDQKNEADQEIATRAKAVLVDYVKKPASESLSILIFIRVTIDKDAPPGPREIRLQTAKGLSNPLPFHIGQLPEVSRTPMSTSKVQTLGKEQLALRTRPDDEIEQLIRLPCTLNGQIASGEINQYRFAAKAGQKLVISTLARQLVPYIADAVPGWFQPVLTLQNAGGKEVAYNDDYFFKPDPVILYKVEADGEYILTIHDSIYRGREDFVYRITIGETPFITSIFPLGGRAGQPASIKIDGWNLLDTTLESPSNLDGEGIRFIAANRKDILSNRVPFALDTLPECFENDANDNIQSAQQVTLPIIINGRSDRPGDVDVFKVSGNKGDTLVAEVYARRLDSPLDSILKLTDESGNILAVNDDHADPGDGLNTHHADSYLMATLPATGTYFIHLSDTARKGGSSYAYRLRLSEPRPDFELRTVPSRINFGGKAGKVGKSGKSGGLEGPVEVYAIRKDGYNGPIQLDLKDPPKGFTARTVTLPAGKEKVLFTVSTTLKETEKPVPLIIEGSATCDGRNITRQAVPSEDWMQAFLWRHLVPTEELLAQVFNTDLLPESDRPLPDVPGGIDQLMNIDQKDSSKGKKDIAGQVRTLNRLYEDRLITENFYRKKIEDLKSYKEPQ